MTDRPKLTLERTFKASLEEVWELWTTKDGIESWWGPEGFSVVVRELDLRPGGELVYEMTATARDQIDFMKKAGMPQTTRNRLAYTNVVPPKLLAYNSVVDFVPGQEAYQVETLVELDETRDGVHMVLTFDAMHDDRWTQLAVMGHESELDRLERLLAARG